MYEDWITKQEARERTGLSERTLERKIQDGELRREFRPIPGRKPLAVFHPDDVALLEEKTLKPIVVQTPVRQPDIPTMAALFRSVITPDKKLYLTIEEASQYSGLPKTYIRRQIRNGAINAVKLAGWRVRRTDLENHAA